MTETPNTEMEYKIRSLGKLNALKKRQKSKIWFPTKTNHLQRIVGGLVICSAITSGIMGIMSFQNTNSKLAKAAAIEPSVVLQSNLYIKKAEKLKKGDIVKMNLELSNLSYSVNLTNFKINLFSSSDSIKWEKITTGESTTSIAQNIALVKDIKFKDLVKYQIEGVLTQDMPDISAQAKFEYKYGNLSKYQETEKINILKGGAVTTIIPRFVGLKTDKISYKEDEPVSVTVQKEANQTIEKGKIVIFDKQNKEIATAECVFVSGLCKGEFGKLPLGDYKAVMLVDAVPVSLIANFKVQKNNSAPETLTSYSSDVSIQTSYGAASINGNVAINIQRAISKNVALNKQECQIEIYKDATKITEINTPVDQDRNCFVLYNLESLGYGNYTFKLKGTTVMQSSVYSKPRSGVFVTVGDFAKGEDLKIQATLPPEMSQLVGELMVLNQTTGNYKTYNKIGENPIASGTNNLDLTIPKDVFEQNGNYLVTVRLADIYLENFAISVSNNQLGFAGSDILVDNLVVGKDIKFSLKSLVTQDGVIAENGECKFLINQNGKVLEIIGKVAKGLCEGVLLAKDNQKSGAITVSVVGLAKVANFEIEPDIASVFGALEMANQSVDGVANKTIVGPILDNKGNLASIKDYRLIYQKGETIVREIPISGDGYLEDIIPASLINAQTLKIKLVDNVGKEILSKDFTSVKKDVLFDILPDKFEKENLNFDLKSKELKTGDICNWEYSVGKNIDKGQVASKDGRCEILIKPTNAVKNDKALLKVSANEREYFQIVKTDTKLAVGTFDVFADTNLNEQNLLETKLVATNILDKNGNKVNNESIKWNYNGMTQTSKVENGQSTITLADLGELENENGLKYAKLDIDVKATKSVSKNNSVKFFVGDKKVSQKPSEVEIVEFSDYSVADSLGMIATKSDSCSVYLNKLLLSSVFVDGICYTQYKLGTGKYNFNFVKNDRLLDTLQISVGTEPENSFVIDNKIFSTNQIEAILFDGTNQYKFESKKNDNFVEITKDGLDPLKAYKVIYTLKTNDKLITKHITIKGSLVMPK